MLLEAACIAGIAYFAARPFVGLKVCLKPHAMARAIHGARSAAQKAVDEVRRQMVTENEWRESVAQRRAQAVYDATVADVFANATEEEKKQLLALFARYAPKDGE